MDSSIHADSLDSPQRVSLSGPQREKDELKHLLNNVDLMKNRVLLLRQQLQKEKDVIEKHKSLTKEVVQQKIEFNKLNAIVPPSPSRKSATTMPSTRRSPSCDPATTPSARCIRTR